MNGNAFDVLKDDLHGSKLIEASAGTGKTFSIAVLALRMILAEKIPVEKILMVTFTKAAAAELENRIRIFLRKGSKYLSGEKDQDDIDTLIREAIDDAPGTKEDKLGLLNKAIQSLDKLAAFTIHGFCQQTIDEFTFETDQSFDYEILTNDSLLLEKVSNSYMREQLNNQEAERLMEIINNVKLNKFPEILRKHMTGMKFIDGTEAVGAEDLERHREEKYKVLEKAVNDHWDEILAVEFKTSIRLKTSRKSQEEFLPVFINFCCKQKKYIEYFEFLYYPYGEDYGAALDTGSLIYNDFFDVAGKDLEDFASRKGLITYNEQIRTIHSALSNEALKDGLRKKYKAVFIDEFQDTDKHQYEIFRDLFKDHAAVYYIGDPKQSIYGWRGADLDTYKAAKREMDGDPLPMYRNFRSTPRMLDALDILFKAGGANMFDDDEITYIPVRSGLKDPSKMTDNGHEPHPITVWEFDRDHPRLNYRAVSREILRLLNEEVLIGKERVSPGDIAVLVRTNQEGDEIKDMLAGLNIPAVKRDNKMVLDSDEADLIRYIIKAAISPTRGAINRALNSKYLGYKRKDLELIDDRAHIEEFVGLRKILQEEGIYNMLSAFLGHFGIRKECMTDLAGQRVLTNFNHLAEILHRMEKQHRYTPEEILAWMERDHSDGSEEYEQRIESDEDAVQIATVHKAKGLEYNIVFAPCLSITPPSTKGNLKKGRVNDFRKGREHYFTLNFKDMSQEDKDAFMVQNEQGNRRLLYVALTRAVHKCYISSIPKGEETSLSALINNYSRNPALIEHVQVNGDLLRTEPEPYDPDVKHKVFSPRPAPDIIIKQTFKAHSFSGLSKGGHHSVPFEKKELGTSENYDQFIFQDLVRGATAGNALHSIFERLDFTNKSSWEQCFKNASKYYPNIFKEENSELFLQMLEHVMKANITFGEDSFSLEEVANSKKLPEMEFFFSLDNINRKVINEILGEEAELSGESDIGGLMNGFIDLLFEHNGKYYILDWKSNHLGNSVDEYDNGGMTDAMKANNYTLQYMIYTIALKRWLENRIKYFDFEKKFGGIIYIFLRGARCNEKTGIFTAKPNFMILEKLDQSLTSKNESL